MRRTGLGHKVVVQTPPLIRRRSRFEAGPVAARGIGRQRELAHDEQAAVQPRTVQVLQAAVHLPVCVAEDAQLEQFGQQLVALHFGIALFGVQSIDKALALHFSVPVAVVMATITGIGGGLVRDVLAQRPNLLLSREIYATTIIVGSLCYIGLMALGEKTALTTLGGVAVTFVFRSLAIYRHWRMPKWLTLRSNLNG